MVRSSRAARVGLAALACGLAAASRAEAIFLDDDKLLKLTALVYTQERMAVSDSSPPDGVNGGGTKPNVKTGQITQIRNYANPVLEGTLTKAFGLEGVLDDLSFRFAGRLVYDGVYDFGAGQFAAGLRRYTQAASFFRRRDDGTGLAPNDTAPIFQGDKPVERMDGSLRPCGSLPLFSPVCNAGNAGQRAARIRDQEIMDPREQFAQQLEAWEVYVNVAKGPVFLRIGRQNLSWGETDGQRLLDLINPLNRFFGLPFDEELDEQRIPLWMIRGNLQLVSALGPLSSTGLEAFWVPGAIDTTQNPFNVSGNHPYGPPSGCDPQLLANAQAAANTGGTLRAGCQEAIGGLAPPGLVKTTLYERLPAKQNRNSRFGARIVGVLFRDYTFSLAGYQSYADVPQPRVHYLDILQVPNVTLPISLPTTVIPELTHGKETVVGGTLSFYQPSFLPGVVRSEVGYFMNEPAYVDIANKGLPPTPIEAVAGATPFLDTFVPKADYVRWVIGYDMYQLNVPWISRTNNLVVVSQWFAEYNLSSTDRYERLLAAHVPASMRDPDRAVFAFGNPQPDRVRNGLGEEAPKLTPIPRFNSIGNNTVQMFLMHGLLTPQLTFVWSPQGYFSLLPNVTYRLRDDLLVKLGYSGIYGKFYGGGFFRDRDQVGIRVSYLLS